MNSKKLRVLQVGKYYPPVRGGIETHLEVLCQGLRASGEVDVEVVVANEQKSSEEEVVDGIPVHRIGTTWKFAGAPICRGMRRAIQRARPDIVHLHVPHPTGLLAYLASGVAARLVCTYHSDIIRQKMLSTLIAPVQDLAFRRAGAFLSASPDLIEASAVLSKYRDRCVVIPFGTDAAVSNQLDQTTIDKIHRKYPTPITLAVGRLVYYKGFHHLIPAMALAEVPGTLLIVGEGPMRPALENAIESAGLRGRVHLLGNISDVTPYYRACDLFVLPSVTRNEAFGIVQLEAMACGKPVINTQLDSGVPFVSRDGETGLTVPPADTPALAKALRTMLADAEMRTRFGAAARARVQAEFTKEKMIARTLDVYRRVAAGLSPLPTNSTLQPPCDDFTPEMNLCKR